MAPKITFLAVTLAACAAFAEPICWSDGTWDDSGAPEGVLLSDNEGWWGRSVYTGVTYEYAEAPDAPRDQLRGNGALFGRRLLDGSSGDRSQHNRTTKLNHKRISTWWIGS